MADPIVQTDLVGHVLNSEDERFLGAIQQFGNFPCPTNINAPGQSIFEQSYRGGYTLDGCFPFSGADVSPGQQVLFDLAQGQSFVYACNIRVP